VGSDTSVGFFEDRAARVFFAALHSLHPPPCLEGEHPLMQVLAADPEGLVLTLAGAGNEPIEGH
jgi:hypothetical protein